MAATSIEWCDHSINPIKMKLPGGKLINACVKVSPGCANCYAESITGRFWPIGGAKFPGYSLPILDRGEIVIDESKLWEVLHRRKPTRYFWCDMNDLFGEWVSFEMIDRCFAVMALTPQHTHLVLTKRAKRMAEWVSRHTSYDVLRRHAIGTDVWPLPNVWLGVSAEDQQRLDERVPHLLRCPAQIRFLSLEPLLAPIDRLPLDVISWTIIGGESGPGARPSNLAWHRSIRDQCREAGVAFFEKQLGSNPVDYKQGIGTIPMGLNSRKGNDMSEWPIDLRVREFPK